MAVAADDQVVVERYAGRRRSFLDVTRRRAIITPTDISVVGPMARHAEDLDRALRTLAGPDLLQRTVSAGRVAVGAPPPARRVSRRSGASSLLCWIDTSVSDVFVPAALGAAYADPNGG
jgi:hypothetical protein